MTRVPARSAGEAARGTSADDLRLLACDLCRALRADQLWIHLDLPSGPTSIRATRDGAGECAEPPGALLRVERSISSEGPARMARQDLPDGWRAGVLVPLRTPDGWDAGLLAIGWTRRRGRWAAVRASSRTPSLALISAGRWLRALSAGAWTAYETERQCSRLRQALDARGVAVMTLDAQGRIESWSAAMARLTDLPGDHAVGRPACELFTLADEDGTPLRLADGPQGDVELATLTGRRLRLRAFSFARANGSAQPMTAVFLDRTMERRLKDVQLTLATVRHELRDQLTMIRGHAQLLETMLAEDHARRSLEAIVQTADVMTYVTEDLVHLNTESPAGSAAEEAVEVGPFLLGIVQDLPSAASRTTVSPSPGVIVRADPIRLRECVLLILSNADKYAPDGEITISVHQDGTYGLIDIADGGTGIPAAERQRVLRPYYRLPEARNLPGSGLGLHIAQERMKAMHGRLGLSRAASGGLKVSLWLPLFRLPDQELGAQPEVRA